MEAVRVGHFLVNLMRHTPQHVLDLVYLLGRCPLRSVRVADVHHDQSQIVVGLVDQTGQEFSSAFQVVELLLDHAFFPLSELVLD